MLLQSYADSWDLRNQRPGVALSEAAARARHDAGERYSVLLGDGRTTEKVITLELAAGVITALFLDSHQRLAWRCVYAQREGDRMFLQRSEFYNYLDGDLRGERAAHSDITDFSKDGRWHTKLTYVDGSEEEDGMLVNVAEQWEPVPAFGEYASISRYV